MAKYYKGDDWTPLRPLDTIGTERPRRAHMYTALGEHTEEGLHPSATMLVQPGEVWPNFQWSEEGGYQALNSLGKPSATREPTTLFDVEEPIIHYVSSHPDVRHTVPTLLGMAINDAGGQITAARELTKYSSPIVKRGIAAGVVKGHEGNPSGDTNITNELLLKQNWWKAAPNPEVPAEEVAAGRATARKVIRTTKPTPRRAPQPAEKPHQLSFQFDDVG